MTRRGKLYWAQRGAGGERIEAADCDGGRRRLLLAARDDDNLAGVTSQ